EEGWAVHASSGRWTSCINATVMRAPRPTPACLLSASMIVTLAGCNSHSSDNSLRESSRALSGQFTSVDPAVLQQDDGQWIMPAKNYASTRFSGLTEINTGNVRQLGVAWTFSTGMVSGHEAPPLIVGSSMYLITPFPN